MKPLTRRALLKGIAGAAGGITVASALAACGGGSANTKSTPPGASAAQATSVSGTAAPQPSPNPPHVDLVRFAWWTDVGNPTPFQISTSGPGGAVLLTLTFDTLTWKDDKGIIPWLATGWEAAPDGTSYTFRLVDGATWHDGTPLTADDVKFSFDYYRQFPYQWMAIPMVKSAELVPTGVRINLNRPYAAFLEDIAGIVPIIPRHIWEPVTDPRKYDQPDATVGSGPFQLAAYNATEGAYRLTVNQRYWRGVVRVTEWRQLTVPAEARIQVVQRGDADISLSTDASVVSLLQGDARLKIFQTAPLSVVRLTINTERVPVDQKAVRQAIAYALDRARIAETITRGPAIVGSAGVVPPETPWYDPALTQYDYDPARARELLAGQRYTIDLIADTSAREPDLMAPMLEAVGITLNVQRVDTATRTQLLNDGNFQVVLTSHIGVGSDPDYLRRWYAGEETNAFAKGSIFNNAEYTTLGEEEAATLDPNKRRTIIFQMQEILADELPTIVLYYRRFYWVYDPTRVTPMETWGGLLNGVPFPNNKLTVIGT